MAWVQASPAAQRVKNLPAMQETWQMWIQPLDQEDPLEEEMATHSSILAWKIPWTGEPGGQQSMESQESDTTEHIKCAQALRSQKSTFKCISAVALVCGFLHYVSHGN